MRASVGREKMRALDGAALAELAKTDELELLYLQLHSMCNFNEVNDRLVGTVKEDEPGPASAPAVDRLQ